MKSSNIKKPLTCLIQVTRVYHEHMEEISKLNPFNTTINGKKVTVKYHVLSTMHDGKEVTVLVKDVLR